jgi:hypothetical protein
VTAGWPDKLPMPAQFVVWAMRSLTPTERIVWYHHWFLDAGGADGCYASPRSMGPRCGTTPRVIEECRGRLRMLGFLARRSRAGTAQHGWRATIPQIQNLPRSLKEASEVSLALASTLDLYVTRFGSGPTLEPGDDEQTSPGSSGVRTPVRAGPLAGGASREGGRGESASSSSQANSQLLPAVEDGEEEAQKQEGVIARDHEKRGGSATRLSGVLPDVLRSVGAPAA